MGCSDAHHGSHVVAWHVISWIAAVVRVSRDRLTPSCYQCEFLPYSAPMCVIKSTCPHYVMNGRYRVNRNLSLKSLRIVQQARTFPCSPSRPCTKSPRHLSAKRPSHITSAIIRSIRRAQLPFSEPQPSIIQTRVTAAAPKQFAKRDENRRGSTPRGC